jgi:4-hydroxybenzoate polyprenyltransferase
MSGRLRISALLRHIRFDEVFVLQGTPLMGVVFSIGTITTGKFETIPLFLASSVLLVAHIFTLNDWADVAHGLKAPDPRVPPRLLLSFSLSLLIASFLVFALLGSRVVIVAVIIAALGFFYSHPRLNAKGTPIASSLPHLVGGIFHFLLGYAVFMPIDQRGVFIAVFFALTFAAGHLNHEVRDFELDQKNKARTNAVAFGKRATFIAGLIVFSCAYLCLFLLGWFRFIPRPLSFLAILFYPLHLYWSVRALRSQLEPELVDRFQTQYRSLYALIGISMLCSVFYS